MKTKTFDRGQIIIIAGMSRAGTTFLYHNLQKHPRVFLPARKECGYFSYHYDNGLDWYLDFFRQKKPEQVTFDISGMYFMDPQSIDRIIQFNPGAKVILGIRDPSHWIFSLYEQYTQNFQVPPFPQFLDGCTVQREGKAVPLRFDNQYVSRTIAQFRQAFGKNLLLYDFEILKQDSLALLRAIENFSGIPVHFQHGNYNDSKINARGRRRVDFFYKWMHKKGLVDMILKLVPRKLILALRNRVDSFSAGKVKDKDPGAAKSSGLYDEAHLKQVEELFREDSAYIKELFKDSPLILGNGERFQ